MSDLLDHLFQSRSRTAALRFLLQEGWSGSVSELARRAGLTPRAVASEVDRLASLGLVRVEAVGGTNQVHAVTEHPAAKALRSLLEAASAPVPPAGEAVRRSLVVWGAPLNDAPARDALPLEEAVVGALELARRDATVLRVLPVVLARNENDFDWRKLKELARRHKVAAELGMVCELTSDLTGRTSLKKHVDGLRDRRRKVRRSYPESRSRYEIDLARDRTPRAARKWGFLMNISEDSFRSTLDKHLA